MPPELCEVHDLRIDEYGCWACGHAGPITEDLWDTWDRWALDRFAEMFPSRVRV